MNKEFKKLQKENDRLRDKIAEMTPEPYEDEMFITINKLIENEIEQEKMCGE